MSSTSEGRDYRDYTIHIEFEGFLTRFDIDEIISSIDSIVESQLLPPSPSLPSSRYGFPWPPEWSEGLYWGTPPRLSYVGVVGVSRGSISLVFTIAAAVALYVANRFKKGVNDSLFAKELERSGRMFGDALGPIVERINNWAERYVPAQREVGGRVKHIKVVENESQPA